MPPLSCALRAAQICVLSVSRRRQEAMLLIIVLFASSVTPIIAGWEAPLESAAKAPFRVKFVGFVTALLLKISPQEREEISKGAAIASQRARCAHCLNSVLHGRV